ncbi:response regulator transcription factor [Nonomuraea basaltis]|uniref:response regulator transcription factor n=1 Tax=Nonomuraea basaltis TaxID=2495887 RepID=UPI00110C4582|nr:response regulator transcription factor [Nonomuraea basaltis]TMR95768.1 response regulator transcription factor [Nonomuraea basaltis]
MRILLVEDDAHVAEPLKAGLVRHGHDVEHVTTGAEALLAGKTDLVLLDLGLPDLDGLEVCRRLREFSDVPIIVLTARSEEIDRVIGLQGGADDYVVKPYGFRELLARIEAVTRRASRQRRDAEEEPPADRGKLVVDRRTRRALLDGVALELTRREFDLLAFLAEDGGALRTREEIMDRVWDENWFGSTRTLDVHVGSLRAKLGDPSWIETVRGVGFRLVEPGS